MPALPDARISTARDESAHGLDRRRAEETLVLLGPNGPGETTCLDLIAGLRTPDGGQIALDRSVTGPLLLAQRAREIGA
ncbi:MAG: ATP-binding cassette domain-containing protein [bacterium]